MATQPIKTSDIIQENVLQKTIKEFQAWDKVIKIVETDLKELAKVTKEGINVIDEKDAKSIQELNEKLLELKKQTKALDLAKKESEKASKNIVKLRKEESDAILRSEKVLQAEERTKQQSLRTQDLSAKAIIRERKELERIEKERQKNSKSILQSTSAYKKLTSQTNKAQLEFKELAAQYGVTSTQAQKALNKFNKLDDSLRIINKTVKDGRRDVGRYGIALQGASSKLLSLGSNLVGGLGVVAGVQLFTQVIKDSFNIVRNFEKEQSKLSAILGKNKDEISQLTELTKELGATTVFSASQSTQGAIELARAGFSLSEIQQSLGATLNLATVGSIELSKAADITSNVISGFGLNASETNRVVDILAKSSTSANVTIESLGESFKEIASTSKVLNIPIEEVGAAINTLGNSGIKGTAATNTLQSSLLRLADPTKKAKDSLSSLGVELFDSEGEFIGLTETVDVLGDSFKDLTTEQQLAAASQIFGKNAANNWLTVLGSTKDVLVSDLNPATKELLNLTDDLGTVTLEGADVLKLYTSELENSSGAAEKFAKESLNNLDGDIKLLRSTWEGLILSFESGDGILSNLLRGIIQATSFLLEVFIKANTVIGIFIDKLAVEFKPIIDIVKELFSSFGDFNTKASVTEILLSRLVIGFKLVLLPIRLLVQSVLALKDSFVVVVNEGKKLLNLFGAGFKIEPDINPQILLDRLSKIKDVLVDTFTVDEIVEPEIIKNPKNDKDKDDDDDGDDDGDDDVKELTGAIEKQQKVVSDLETKKRKAEKKDIAALNIELEKQKEILTLLQNQGLAIDNNSTKVDDSARRRKEANETIKQINLDRAADDIEIQGRNLKETLANIDEKSKREEKAIRNRYRRLLEQDGLLAEEKAKIQLELQNELADSEKKFSDLSDSFKNKDLEKYKDLQESLTEALKNALDSRFDLIQANLDKEIDASKKQQDRLQDLADKGSADALESLQAEREKEQKLEEEKLKQERKQANIKKGIEVYKILASNDGDVGKTISDVAILEALIKSLPTAYDGMEDTGSGGNLDSKGGFLSVLHPNEAVVKASTNKKKLKAGLTNEQAVEYAIKYQHLKPKMNDKIEVKNDNSELKDIRNILKDLPNNMPTQDLFFDEQEKAYVRIIKQNGKVNRIHTRSKGLFR